MKPWMILSAVKRPQTVNYLWPRLKMSLFFMSAFLLSLLTYFDAHLQTKSRSALLDATAFITDLCRWPAQTGSFLTASLVSHFDVYEKNKKLRDENRTLRAQHSLTLALAAENNRLRNKLKVIKEIEPEFSSVRVIGAVKSPYQHNVLLGSGEKEGIQVKSAVLVDRQILGRIIEVGNYSCRVLLMTDPQSHIPIVLEKSGVQGILSGDNSSLMRIRVVEKTLISSTGNAVHSLKEGEQRPKVAKGEYVFTSGQGGVFPTGFVVGRVVEVTPHEILVQSMIDMTQLEYVQVVKPYEESVDD